MMTYFIIGGSAILFLLGIVFIVRGINATTEDTDESGLHLKMNIALTSAQSENQRLQASLQELEQKLEDSAKKNTVLENQINGFTHEIEKLKSDLTRELNLRGEIQLAGATELKEKDEENLNLKTKLEDLARDLERSKKSFELRENEIDTINKKFNEANQENLKLITVEREKSIALQSQINELLDRQSKLVQEITQKDQALSEQAKLLSDVRNVQTQSIQSSEEINVLQQEINDFQSQLQKFQEMNAQFLQREKTLQYELTKSRAQVLGLEKICADFKTQLDAIHKDQLQAKLK